MAANPPAPVPTNEQIVRSNNHILNAQHSQQFEQANLTDETDENSRHSRILAVRCDNDRAVSVAGIAAGVAEIVAQLTQIKQGLTQIKQKMNQGVIRIETLRLVDRARATNYRNTPELNAPFVILLKHDANHPNFNPPQVDGVQFLANYNIGDAPPNNLVPRTHARFKELMTAEVHEVRALLRAVFWFYNSPDLYVAHDLGEPNCRLAVQRLKNFLINP